MLKPPKKFLVPYLLLLEVHTYIWQCGIPQLIILKKALKDKNLPSEFRTSVRANIFVKLLKTIHIFFKIYYVPVPVYGTSKAARIRIQIEANFRIRILI